MKKGIKKMTYLPDELNYRGKTYVRYSPERDDRLNPIPPNKDYVEVHVLSNNLRGRTDLHGNEYKPTKHFMVIKESITQQIAESTRNMLNEMDSENKWTRQKAIENIVDSFYNWEHSDLAQYVKDNADFKDNFSTWQHRDLVKIAMDMEKKELQDYSNSEIEKFYQDWFENGFDIV